MANIHALLDDLNPINDRIDGLGTGFQGTIKITDTKTENGIYIPTEEGTYANAGGLEYDPTEGLTYFIRTDGVWTKNVTPINFTPTGVVEEGNAQAVSGGEVYEKTRVILSNIATNGDFSNGLDTWSVGSNITDAVVNDGILSFTGVGQTGGINYMISQNISGTENDIVYVRITAKGNGNVYLNRGTPGANARAFSLSDDFQEYSTIFKNALDSIRFSITGGVGDFVEVDNIIILNLSEIFTDGNVIEKVSVDTLIENSLYFENLEVKRSDLLLQLLNKADHGYTSEPIKTLKDVEMQNLTVLENILTNGDFSNGLDTWSVGSNITDAVVNDGILSFTGVGNSNVAANQIFKNINKNDSDKIYIATRASGDGRLGMSFGLSSTYWTFDLSEDFEVYSNIQEVSSNRFKFGAFSGQVNIDYILVINLTALFGVGNEPEKQDIDDLVNFLGYFDGKKSITAKQLIDIQNNRLDDYVRKELKVLLIGSSHGIDSILHFPMLAKAAGIEVTVGNLYQGGITLDLIRQNIINNTDFQYRSFSDGTGWRRAASASGAGTRTVEYMIQAEKWDYIILQRGASESNVWGQTQYESLNFIMDYIKDNVDYNPKFLFNSGFSYAIGSTQTPTRADQIQRTLEINNTLKTMQENVFLDIIPNATAIQNARSAFLANFGEWEYNDMARDQTHLDNGIGCYITGCVLFEVIIGKRFDLSIRNLDKIPSYQEVYRILGAVTSYTEITEEMAKVAKLCAIAAVNSPYEVSETIAINFPV